MKADKRRSIRRPTGIDLFAGAGGMSLGFEQAGFDVAAAVDLDPVNVSSHTKNFPHCRGVQADVSTLSGKSLLDLVGLSGECVDVLFGGPPCQGFSLIGRRRIEDERNLLLSHFARLVREIRPRYFVLENVPGLMMGNCVEILHSFTRCIRKAGYDLVEPVRILDAADFGVPQRRQRAFVLGFRKGIAPPRYPEPDANFCDSGRGSFPTVWDAIGDLPDLGLCPELLESDRYHGSLGRPSEYAKRLRALDAKGKGVELRKTLNGRGLGGCLRTKHSSDTQRRFAETAPGTSEKVSRFFRLSCGGMAPTLRAGTGPDFGSHTAARPIHPKEPRCITTREAARLHSFPDWFEFHPTKWHGFRQVGNSVPPLLAQAVALALFELLASDELAQNA